MSFAIDKEIDLRGEVCPYTFVFTKLQLEEMEPNQILQVTLDYPPAVENIPRSIKNQNLGIIINITKNKDNEWKIVIKKK
ncbi:MAG: sulfurtransferase TusA family protein [Candidatus Helarchaeota archaeon]